MPTLSELEFLRLPFAELGEGLQKVGDGAAAATIPHLSVRPEDVPALGEPAMEPPWRWPLAFASALALHAGIGLLLALGSPQLPPPPGTIEVTIVAEADATSDLPPNPAAATDQAASKDATPTPNLPSTAPAATPQPESQPEADTASPPTPDPTRSAAEAPQTLDPAPPPRVERAPPSPPREAASAPVAPEPPQSPAAPAPAMWAELPSAEEVPPKPPSTAEPNPVPHAPESRRPVRSSPAAKPPAALQPTPLRQILNAPPKHAEKPLKAAALEGKSNRAAPASADSAPVGPQPRGGTAPGNPSTSRPGNPGTSQMSRGVYGALLSEEIARHKIYLEGAREAGFVSIELMVGPSGRIVSHTITQSSGYASIDNDVHAMMRAVQAPPPPGGSFQGHVRIRFGVREPPP